jgi:hypothetical protein
VNPISAGWRFFSKDRLSGENEPGRKTLNLHGCITAQFLAFWDGSGCFAMRQVSAGR